MHFHNKFSYPLGTAVAVLVLLCHTQNAHASDKANASVTAAACAGYNHTWGGFGGADVIADISAGTHFRFQAALEALSSNVHTAGVTIQPEFPLGKGVLYIEGRLLNRFVARNKLFDFTASTALGWRMKHCDLALGVFYRTLGEMVRDKANTDEYMVSEPFNAYYRLQFMVMGDEHNWDIFGGISNAGTFWMERHIAPYFYVGGRYDINKSLSVLAKVDIQQSGMFHLSAQFYGLQCRAGIKYTF